MSFCPLFASIVQEEDHMKANPSEFCDFALNANQELRSKSTRR